MQIDIDTTTPNYTEVMIGDLKLYFSYSTVIAFAYRGKLTIRENEWSVTTGKQLNRINPDKSIRISGDEFERRLANLRLEITRDSEHFHATISAPMGDLNVTVSDDQY